MYRNQFSDTLRKARVQGQAAGWVLNMLSECHGERSDVEGMMRKRENMT